MKKPWSITTTLRNPERLRDFLIVLKSLEGKEWNLDSQRKFQILLIQNRIYGYGNTQFYNGLTQAQIKLIDDFSKNISYQQAEEIFKVKKYEDPSMRGRQSINPLKKFGLVMIKEGKIHITDLGHILLKEDFDLGEMFFRSFIKWQIPNPANDDYNYEGGYDIKPFIGALHLINRVNQKATENGKEPKGISKQEFSLFGPSLVNYEDIDGYANEIIQLRKKQEGKSKAQQREILKKVQTQFAKKFLGTKEQPKITKLLNNLKDYGDNAVRYFRLTRYIHIRGGGFYIDLEPRRSVEINNLLKYDNAKSIRFPSEEGYSDYIANIQEPKLPWETKEKYIEIIGKLIGDVQTYEKKLKIVQKKVKDINKLSESELKNLIEDLRQYRRDLQEKENHEISQDTSAVQKYIEQLSNIHDAEDKPLMLEKYTSLSLQALNDSLKIQPNYPVGDDNEPTFTAPAGKPDIECYYKDFNAICEVTMLKSRDQWYNEGQPVMRHLRDFEDSNSDKETYCIFVAPSLHRDTLNTFWVSIKYEYEGRKQKIIPLSIQNFIQILKILLALKQSGKFLPHQELRSLYKEIIGNSSKAKDSATWLTGITKVIEKWGNKLNKTL